MYFDCYHTHTTYIHSIKCVILTTNLFQEIEAEEAIMRGLNEFVEEVDESRAFWDNDRGWVGNELSTKEQKKDTFTRSTTYTLMMMMMKAFRVLQNRMW